MHGKSTNSRQVPESRLSELSTPHSVLRHLGSALRRLPPSVRPLALSAFLFPLTPAWAGWSFDTGLSPEATRDLLAVADSAKAPRGSWLRFQDMACSRVRDESNAEAEPWLNAKPSATLAERRAALLALRNRGYRFVAMVRWPTDSWLGGVRPDQALRRLPLDLREAYERSRLLGTTYGDLIDYWEIDNEPDISFVEENPETYAAFLKACYLGFRSQPSAEAQTPRVLAAAFALPPGPYFEAWLANDGLRYTDGFNYHYYGYAEDFTGVYQQFERAVVTAPAASAAGEAVLQTRFYPSGAGWQTRVLSRFAASEGSAAANRALLQSRPLAAGEPALQEQGRWLASAGTTVKETAEGWEFTVAAPAPGPLRPAMAELPLPEDWSVPLDASLMFEYRTERAGGGNLKPEVFAEAEHSSHQPPEAVRSTRIVYSKISGHRSPLSALPAARTRKLPVFLTEYGYGLLDKNARNTSAGREAQRAWFAAVQPQIKALQIEGAMAFVLRPYLEADKNEFGLLMDAAPDGAESRRQTVDDRGQRADVGGKGSNASIPPSVVRPPSSTLGGFAVSPALVDLLAANAPARSSRPWSVATPSPGPVVMDFVAGSGLQMSKPHRGYVLQSDKGDAQLTLYHFGSEPVSGELNLEGTAWTLASGERTTQLALAPGERRAIPLAIQPAKTDRFGAQVVTARFRLDAVRRGEPSGKGEAVSEKSGPSSVSRPPASGPSPAPPSEPRQELEVFLRTAKGNLYQTWPRPQARESWQWYVQSLADFTPAFFGRAHVPTALADNRPAALVFFFRPDKYPMTYTIRRAQLVEYVAAKAASGKR